MSEIKFSLPGADTVTLSRQTVDKLLRAGDGDAALLYLYIIKTGAQSTSEETMAALGKGPGCIASSMAVLSRLGLIELDNDPRTQPNIPHDAFSGGAPEPADAQPWGFTAAEMNSETEPGSDFMIVVEETQRTFGRLLSPDELMRLYGVYRKLDKSPEVILQLITYSISESKRAGGGRMLSMMRYIEKASDTWASEEITTLEKAEAYIKTLEARRITRDEMKAVMQVSSREFSSSEKKYVDGWILLGFDVGAVEIAYEITLEQIHEYKISYMNGIMNKWHKKGLHTAQEIIKSDGRKQGNNPQKHQGSSAFGNPDQEEIKRMQRLLDKTKKN